MLRWRFKNRNKLDAKKKMNWRFNTPFLRVVDSWKEKKNDELKADVWRDVSCKDDYTITRRVLYEYWMGLKMESVLVDLNWHCIWFQESKLHSSTKSNSPPPFCLSYYYSFSPPEVNISYSFSASEIVLFIFSFFSCRWYEMILSTFQILIIWSWI